MQTPEALKAQIGSTEDLQSVVKTMKALAAVSIQQYEAAIAALRDYSRTIDLGLQILLQQPQFAERFSDRLNGDITSDGHQGLMIFGSDQGLCGQFNQQIVQHLAHYLGDIPNDLKLETDRDYRVAVMGARPLPSLQDLGIHADERLPVPSTVDDITSTVQDLVLMIEQWREQDRVSRILLFYNRPTSGASYEPHIVQLLPLDPQWLQRLQTQPWEGRCLPTVLMQPHELFSKLVQQYLFITLYQAIAASLASENASRLAAMQSAESNIRDRLTDLTMQYRQQRQSAITAELLDVVSGFEALTDKT
jgi:F-type H+-transporting ATPase subunit gamma